MSIEEARAYVRYAYKAVSYGYVVYDKRDGASIAFFYKRLDALEYLDFKNRQYKETP